VRGASPQPSFAFRARAPDLIVHRKFPYIKLFAMAATFQSDVKFLLEEKGVAADDMKVLEACGLLTMSRLSLIADARAGARTMISGLLKLDPADPAGLRRVVAVLDAWETATTRMEVQRQQDAEAKGNRLPKTVTKASGITLRQAAEAVIGPISDKLAPGSALLELIFEQVEEHSIEAIPLTQVVCIEDGEELKTCAVVDNSGLVRIKKGRTDVPMPTDSEAFRRKIRCWGLGHLYAKLKHPGRAWLQSVSVELTNEYLDYILGERVKGLEAKDQDGVIVARPSWNLVLAYDFQVRKEAARRIMKGDDFATAMRAAWTDLETRERFFVTPVALSGSAAPSRPYNGGGSGDEPLPKRPRSGKPNEHQGGKGSWKARGKGYGNYSESWKAKGSGKKGGKQKNSGKSALAGQKKTPDGREICFAYNRAGEGCAGKCGRVHVCTMCLQQHPVYQCPMYSAARPPKAH